MRFRTIAVALAVAVVTLALAGQAAASEQFGDLDVSFLSLQVDGRGEALATYRTAAGTIRHVYVWGAINANAPNTEVPQVRFHYGYSGGLARFGRQTWRTFADRCRPYEGPSLV